jgi:hypothetical protein
MPGVDGEELLRRLAADRIVARYPGDHDIHRCYRTASRACWR